MNSPSYNLNQRFLGSENNRLAAFTAETVKAKTGKIGQNQREGNLANTLVPLGNGIQKINVVQDYPWTLSMKKDWTEWEEIPYVRLREYKCVDSSISKQLQFYFQLSKDKGAATLQLAGVNNQDSIDVYSDIWPKNDPTKFEYIFPFFQKTGMELTTEQWKNLEPMGDSLKTINESAGKFFNTKASKKVTNLVDKLLTVGETASELVLQGTYPSVSITDRPKIFSSHNERSIVINCTLYNTLNPDDWEKNRNLAYLLMSQNLFNKRDLTTGVPPVFYDVFVPGQYYSYASCVTNLKVDYLGNQRLLYGEYIVPDAYEISLTLSELVKPSKNQFEAVQSGAARDHVTVNKS